MIPDLIWRKNENEILLSGDFFFTYNFTKKSFVRVTYQNSYPSCPISTDFTRSHWSLSRVTDQNPNPTCPIPTDFQMFETKKKKTKNQKTLKTNHFIKHFLL